MMGMSKFRVLVKGIVQYQDSYLAVERWYDDRIFDPYQWEFIDGEMDAIYPCPDAVFIGGHGGRLKEIISRVRHKLLPGARIVFNSVSEESKTHFIEAANESGLCFLGGTRVAINEYNPIEILVASAPDSPYL